MGTYYDKVTEVINKNKAFLIASHAHPDGDAIGSTLALGLALESLGKRVVMYNQDGVPKNLDFLPGINKILKSLNSTDKYDVTFLIDCAQASRAGRDFPSKERMGELICIDHHVTGCEETNVVCIDDEASSTGEVIYNLLKKIKFRVNADIATLILTTLIVDTGFFRYSNTSSRALNLAAELIDEGASTWNISKNLEERTSPAQWVLLAEAIETIEYHLNGRVATMILTRQMIECANADVEMAEEFINYPRSVDGVEVAVLIREKNPHEYKISFRSKGSINVAALSMKFDGGGHEHAAGCTIKGSLGSVKQTVVKALERELLGK